MADTELPSLDQVYGRLAGYIKWLAAHKQERHIFLSYDDLVGEFHEQVTYGYMYYREYQFGMDRMLRAIKRMLHNRVGELIYKVYLTHRVAEKWLTSTDDLDDDDVHGESGGDPESYLQSTEDMKVFASLLTDEEKEVVLALLDRDDDRMIKQIRLRGWRRSCVYRNPTIRVDYRLVADALHLDYAEARRLWYSIRNKWRSVYAN